MWPFTRKEPGRFESWPIVRKGPTGMVHGRSLSLFINNGNCHLTTIDVYADGAVNCWGVVDLALFTKHIAQRWVVARPEPGQQVSVFHFDAITPHEPVFLGANNQILPAVTGYLRALNPQRRNLLNMHGSDTEMRGTLRVAKTPLCEAKPCVTDPVSGAVILGAHVPIIHRRTDGHHLTHLFVFADGRIRIGPDGGFHPVTDLNQLYRDELITNQLPAGQLLTIPGLLRFTLTDRFGRVVRRSRIGEVQDLLDTLNGRPDSVDRCRAVLTAYTAEPTEANREALRTAYTAVPRHLRMYCGDMDTKDHDIRRILRKK